ncbi:MAG: CHAT domain-containing protein [Planctomycetia bacterium]|nr:CHAT domain-containing protein [Planctomycetia bacterium]
MRCIPLIVIFVLCFTQSLAHAQKEAVPSAPYYGAIGDFYSGHYAEALKNFDSEWRGSFKIATDRWFDSICYATMMGETLYQMGDYARALENFNSALLLRIQYIDWMLTITNVPPSGEAIQLRAVPWGDANAGRRLFKMPDKVSVMFGDLKYSQKVQTGGVVIPPTLRSVRAAEIMRCSALAIRRRAEILGPLAPADDLNAKLLAKLLPVWQSMAGSWMQAFLDIEVGLAYIAAGRTDEGTISLTRGALINGRAHHLSAVVYLIAGQNFLKNGDYEKSFNMFLEAATLAYYFEDINVMDDAFRGLANAYYQRDLPQVCPVLVAAELWARREKIVSLRATLLELLADEHLRMKQPAQAATCLREADVMMNKRAISLSTQGARNNYLRARCAFLNPSAASQAQGGQALASCMKFMQKGSLWNFQISYVDDLFLKGLSERKACDYYALLLREPTANDWALTPIDTLAVSLTPRGATWENWFLAELSLERVENAFHVSERARRSAYLHSLHFGGRLHALRQLLEYPEGDLSVVQLQRRRDILTEYPGYDARAKKSRELSAQLRQMSFPVQDKSAADEASKLIASIATLAAEQEAILNSIVLERRIVDIVFPRVRTLKEVQQTLPKGETMLTFFAARNQMFVFLFNRDQHLQWTIFDAGAGRGSSKKSQSNNLSALQNQLASLLKDLGVGTVGSVKIDVPESNAWKNSAEGVLREMTRRADVDFADADLNSLVIVPDRFAWYIPFEILQLNTPRGSRPMISQYTIRYAPMASLGTPWKKPTPGVSPYSMIVGEKVPPSDNAIATLGKTLDRPVEFEVRSFGGLSPGGVGMNSAILGTIFDRMLVFEDLKNDPVPYDFSPMALDGKTKGASLGHWFSLPWGAPRLVFLSGFHSQASEFSKRSTRKTSSSAAAMPAGSECFFAAMGFLANGTDSVVLSRWRIGGLSSYLLASHFMAQLENETLPAKAWRGAIMKLAKEKIDTSHEPKIATGADSYTLRGVHPFFWASYMLIDSGANFVKPTDAPDPAAGGVDPNAPGLALPDDADDEKPERGNK